SWGYPLWFRFPIGFFELLLGVGLLLPAFRRITIYGIFTWTVFAVITHLQAGQLPMMVVPMIFGFIAWVILFLSKEKEPY
ncbi:MAG: DoxX family protein, partial [Bacteroidia bacterium]